jgi:hypothetical protein
MCCGVEGFILDRPDKSGRIYQRLCYRATGTATRSANLLPYPFDLPYVEIPGNAPVLPVFSGTLPRPLLGYGIKVDRVSAFPFSHWHIFFVYPSFARDWSSQKVHRKQSVLSTVCL